MSRCLPFSPPEAYSKRHSSHDVLFKKAKIKSLRSIEKDLKKKEEEERKSLRRRREESKKELREHADKAEKRHRHVTDHKVTDLGDEKCFQRTRIQADSKDQCPPKVVVYESEDSEKSGVVEEFEPPTYRGSICDVPHRTETTNKRKRWDEFESESERISFHVGLPLKKRGYNPTEPGKSCFSKRSDACPNKPSNVGIEQPSPGPCPNLPSSAPERTQTSDAKKASSSVSDRRLERSIYEMLVVDWVPPTSQQLNQLDDDDDEDWLFGSRKQHKQAPTSHDVVSCSRSTTLWPQAKLLPDVNIYALPYTVPF